MAIDPAGNSGNGRITIDKRISVSSIIQLLFTIVGGLWMFAQLEASVAAEREQLVALRADLGTDLTQLRGDFNATIARLDGRMDALLDRPIPAAK